ncbi:MAG: MFS transporter, partial [Promethearchaeota archaeon]
LATFIVQLGYWRFFFSGMGILIFITLVLFAYVTNEPKRGAQQEELFHILKYDDIDYDFQINKETVRKTMLSKTNIVALIEGIFTWILTSSLNFLILNFIQSPPYNISEFSTAVFIVIFGLSGGLVGQLVLARLSDKLADKNYLYRLPIIVLSIIVGLITFAIFFYLPFQSLTEEQGQNVLFLLNLPVMWWMGLLYFISRSFFSLYVVNQSPVLQQINLPEAQGTITSWNQFLESFGRGIGPALCGVLLAFTGKNFQLTVMFIIICIVPGIILWTLALKWYPDDRKRVKEILEQRAKELKKSKYDPPSRRLIKP